MGVCFREARIYTAREMVHVRNLYIEKQTLVNVDVINGETFLKIKKKEHSKILILVCQQTAKTFDIIAKKLELKGINSNQIIHVMY